MYDWLADALKDSSQLVTANRRLARVLAAHYGEEQIRRGHQAWRSPEISSLSDWLSERIAQADISKTLPVRISGHQSRVLWERCLRREISDPLLNFSALVRQARESWTRLHDFRVPLDECKRAAQGKDQKVFAVAAEYYKSILQRENWIDEAGLIDLLTELLGQNVLQVPDRVTFVGFDRLVPAVDALIKALEEVGCEVTIIGTPASDQPVAVYSYPDADAEMRAAGAWARQQLQIEPELRIAIVSNQLEQQADRTARLIREGFMPAWQTGMTRHRASVNVSYGRSLSDFPAIRIALLALRWLIYDLDTKELGLLLRSAALAGAELDSRARLELNLRNTPSRNWSPGMLSGFLAAHEDIDDWRSWLRAVIDARAELPARQSPSSWAVFIDTTLKTFEWPGERSLQSDEFQLVNRWKELLNDLARLDLMVPSMTFAETLSRLQSMASETIFQPESEGALIQVMGPLEAAGMWFDKLWITGTTASNWPPPGRPSALISRSLQRAYQMPDATPEDTLAYATRVMRRLLNSAGTPVCSYAMTEADVEQTASALLPLASAMTPDVPLDPGWFANQLIGTRVLQPVEAEAIPSMQTEEQISGGAATIQNQMSEPFTAFAFGRLGIRYLLPLFNGLAANIRGTLIHDALHVLYSEAPTQAELTSWTEADAAKRIDNAVCNAFLRLEKYADPVLAQLLELEKIRVAQLLRDVLELDRQRESFAIAETEASLEHSMSGVALKLRIDRIDKLDNGAVIILDYKSGTRKQLLDRDGEPKEMQLLVYASAVAAPVAGVGLINVDSRAVSIDATGTAFGRDAEWEEDLNRWNQQLLDAAAELRNGDVRLDLWQTIDAARPLALLSRFAEIRHGA